MLTSINFSVSDARTKATCASFVKQQLSHFNLYSNPITTTVAYIRFSGKSLERKEGQLKIRKQN